jgi:ABC-type Fe3+-hydroxamate transport system substrate-binding protein
VEKEHPRLVSLVPSWTETLYSWGFDGEIVGVTKWCVHPKELVARAEKVGGTKDPEIARIVALKPDLIKILLKTSLDDARLEVERPTAASPYFGFR